MRKLLLGFLCAMCIPFTYAQVGINTDTPQTTLDVNGNVQLRNELRINNDPGLPGQIYFSQGGSTVNNWRNVNVPFLEDSQYQLVNTYAKKDQLGIDWEGNEVRVNVFTETFEADSPNKAGWTQSRGAGTADWNLSQAGSNAGTITTAHGGIFNARFVAGTNTNATNNPRTMLISPRLTFTGYTSNLRISFWYGQQANGGQNRLRLFYRTSANGAWTQIGTDYQSSITAWTQVANIELPSSANQAYYQIAFEGAVYGTNGRANVLDDIEIYSYTASSAYNTALSPLGETIGAKNWVRIPALDLPVTVNSEFNRISMMFQTGVESRMSATGTGNQVTGNIRYLCGLFRRKSTDAASAATLVALRADQIDNYQGGSTPKQIQDKAQSIFTLNYVVENVVPDSYVFSTACRRLSRNAGGGADNSSLFSIGNSITNSNNVTSDFMMNSIIKMDVIELVTTIAE